MFRLSTKQVQAIYLIKINEVEMCEYLSEQDKEIMKNFYKKKMATKNIKK